MATSINPVDDVEPGLKQARTRVTDDPDLKQDHIIVTDDPDAVLKALGDNVDALEQPLSPEDDRRIVRKIDLWSVKRHCIFILIS